MIAGLVFEWFLRVAVAGGVGVGLLLGMGVGLLFGWHAVLQHFTIRFLLWRQGALPLNVVPFLSYASELLLLQRDGGIYRFRRPLLQDYFADLEQH